MAATAIGWYGPLIDLAQAASHNGDYVQLLVFVHTSRPIQKYKASSGGGLLRTDIHVGDDTRSYFSISIWQKEMASMIFSGDIILLQNVKITKFGDVLGATTVQFSSLLQLVHPYELLASKGVDELLMNCRVGRTTKEKMKRVLEWVQRAGYTIQNFQQTNAHQQKVQRSKNWKLHEERKLQDCTSISEVSGLTDSCNAAFYAYIGEIFLPFRLEPDWEFDKEKLFISKRLYSMEDSKIVEDLICTGCKLCGSCIDSGSVDQNKVPLYCQKSSNYIHDVCLIYRPFLLYVWDQSGHIPLLVKNKAAEILFGNIGAESVYKCFQQKEKKGLIPEYGGNARGSTHSKASEGGGVVGVQSSKIDESQQPKSTWLFEDRGQKKKPDFYSIWLILLELLLKKGNNSPLKFEVVVDRALDEENGRFELANFSMPCDRTNKASD